MSQSDFQRDLSAIHARKGRPAREGQKSLKPLIISVMFASSWSTIKNIERKTKLLPGTIKVTLFQLEKQGLVESQIQNFSGDRSYRLTRSGVTVRRTNS